MEQLLRRRSSIRAFVAVPRNRRLLPRPGGPAGNAQTLLSVAASRRPRMRFAAVAVLAVVLMAALVRRIRIAAGMRRGDQAVIDAKRNRNKRFANKMVTRVGRAGRPHSIFAVIDYTGRHTGRRYTSPIRVVEQPGGFVVPLTYGPRTSWYVNLQAGAGYLHWQGRSIRVGNPALVPTSAVTDQFPLPSRFLLWLDGTDACVRIQNLSEAAAEIPQQADGQAGHSRDCPQ